MAKILTIEDSAFERKAIMNLLRKLGHTDVIEAANGKEGVEKYKAEKPDLVLLDLRLPGEPAGLDVFKELKKVNPGVKCIIISIVRRQESVDEALGMGVKAYIMKPVTLDKLSPEIKKVLG